MKNFKSTISLYGVEPEYFENRKYFEAIEEKIRLAKERIKMICEELYFRLKDEKYNKLNKQLMECKKALKFNENLLKEYKKSKKNETSTEFILKGLEI